MIYELIEAHAERRPSQEAIRFEGESLTFADLRDRIDDAAARLEAVGIGQKSVVATCYANSTQNLVVLYALARLGACVATLDRSYTDHEMTQICLDCTPDAYLADASQGGRLAAIAADVTPAALVLTEPLPPSGGDAPASEAFASPRTPQGGRYLLQYTSGSTGKPKGVLQNQRGLARRVLNWISTASLEPGLEHLCILPLSHGYGSYCVALPALASGGALHMLDLDRVTPRRVLRYLHDHRIQCFYALPYFYKLMATTPRSVEVDLSCLKLAMVGSAPMAPETEVAFADRFGLRLNNTYGTSEAGIITSNLFEDGDAPTGTIGKLIHGMEAGPIAEGEVGELVVRTDGLAEGYFAEVDGPMLDDGWSRTGDLVRRDSRGNYFVEGRLSQFINVSGNKVMPLEIENVIQQVPGVEEAAVIGVQDDRTGQKVAAFVVAPKGTTEDEIRRHCRSKLAEFKVPTFVTLCAELPKTPVGKVVKSRLAIEPG